MRERAGSSMVIHWLLSGAGSPAMSCSMPFVVLAPTRCDSGLTMRSARGHCERRHRHQRRAVRSTARRPRHVLPARNGVQHQRCRRLRVSTGPFWGAQEMSASRSLSHLNLHELFRRPARSTGYRQCRSAIGGGARNCLRVEESVYGVAYRRLTGTPLTTEDGVVASCGCCRLVEPPPLR